MDVIKQSSFHCNAHSFEQIKVKIKCVVAKSVQNNRKKVKSAGKQICNFYLVTF